MRDIFKSTLIAGVITALGLVTTGASAQTLTLRWNNWLPPNHSQLIGTMQPWFKMVEEATKGRVKIVPTDTSLGAPQRQYDLAIDGVADVTLAIGGYTPGRFKLTQLGDLPQVHEWAEPRSVAMWRTYKKYFEKAGEFKDVELMWIYITTGGSIQTSKSPITDLASYKGKKMRVGGGIMDEVNAALGGVNVSVPAGQMYELLSNGVVDGALMGGEGYDSFKLQRVIKYVTTVPGGLYSSDWFVVMNKASWAKISKEDQEAIRKVSGEHMARFGAASVDKAEQVGRKNWDKDGVKVTVASDAFLKDIRERTDFLKNKWLDDAKKLVGNDAQPAYDYYMGEVRNYKMMTN